MIHFHTGQKYIKELLDVVMRNKSNMEKQDKVGKILMGLYQLSEQE